jgi:hypothetical protein
MIGANITVIGAAGEQLRILTENSPNTAMNSRSIQVTKYWLSKEVNVASGQKITVVLREEGQPLNEIIVSASRNTRPHHRILLPERRNCRRHFFTILENLKRSSNEH